MKKIMETLEKNVYFEDVTVVYQSTINGYDADDLFLDRDEAIKWTKQALKELSEELTDEEMERYGFNKNAEDYIDEIDFKQIEKIDGAKRRAATDEYGRLIVEYFDDENGKWYECED